MKSSTGFIISAVILLVASLSSAAGVKIGGDFVITSGGRLVFPDGSTQDTATMQGLQGPKGDAGAAGPVGPQGPQGPQGPSGSGLTWTNVTGTFQPASAGTGYLANNNVNRVVVTLPAAPVTGDIIRVVGVGTGGWQISQNDN